MSRYAPSFKLIRVCPGTSCGIAEPSQHEADGSEAQKGELSAFQLRVCPGTSCRIAELSEHEADRGETEERERLAVEVLPILGQSAAAVKPSYGAFDDPALGEDDEPFRRSERFTISRFTRRIFLSRMELRSLVSAIG